MAKRTSGELKRLSREFLLGNYTVSILAMLTASLLPDMLFLPFTVSLSMVWNTTTIICTAAAIIIELLAQLLKVSVIRIHLLLAQQQHVTAADIFWAFRNQPDRFLLGTLSLWSICLFPVIPAGICIIYLWGHKNLISHILIGFIGIMLLLAELYVVYTFMLIYPLLIEQPKLTIGGSLRASHNFMRGNRLRYFRLQLSFLGWQFLGLCSIGIGMLWIIPYIHQTSTNFYLDLINQFNGKGKYIDAMIADERNAGL